jgi:hypothetical protein
MYALALEPETLASAIADALAPARDAQVRSGVLGGTCLVCGGVTKLAAHAGMRTASCVECESVLEAPPPARLRLVAPGD